MSILPNDLKEALFKLRNQPPVLRHLTCSTCKFIVLVLVVKTIEIVVNIFLLVVIWTLTRDMSMQHLLWLNLLMLTGLTLLLMAFAASPGWAHSHKVEFSTHAYRNCVTATAVSLPSVMWILLALVFWNFG